jgi:5-methylcytosine-specific restriction endonuclease McrA
MCLLFAFDPGLSAIGAAVLRCDNGVWRGLWCGTYILGAATHRGRSHAQNAHRTRNRRRTRRRRRAKTRTIVELLIENQLLPSDPAARRRIFAIDPWTLLDASKSQRLARHELGRVLFHITCGRRSPQRILLRNCSDAEQMCRDLIADQARLGAPDHGPILTQLWRIKTRSALSTQTGAAGGTRRKMRSALPIRAIGHCQDLLADLVARFGRPDHIAVEGQVPDRMVRRHTAMRLSARKRNFLFERQRAAGDGTVRCPYLGTTITRSMLATGQAELDHITPHSRGGTSLVGNLVYTTAIANRAKGAMTPVEAFGIPWPRVLRTHSTARLRPNDASTATETSLQPQHPAAIGHAAVRLTSRFHQMVNARYPATDLLVVPACHARACARTVEQVWHIDKADGIIDRSLYGLDAVGVAMAAIITADGEEQGTMRQIARSMPAASVSVRRSRSAAGRLHHETIYAPPSPDRSSLKCRKPVVLLGPRDLRDIADKRLRERAAACQTIAQARTAVLATGARRVRLERPGGEAIIIVDAAAGRPIAARLPADNHHVDIVSLRDGRWVQFVTTRAARNQPGWRPQWEIERIGGKLVMRLHKGDVVSLRPVPEAGHSLYEVRRIANSARTIWLLPIQFAKQDRNTHGASYLVADARRLQRMDGHAVDCSPSGQIGPRPQ